MSRRSMAPSARAGICWSLKAAMAEEARVRAPTHTCPAVHEAVVRSGASLELADAAKPDFSWIRKWLDRQTSQPHAVVLCAIYGHVYPRCRTRAVESVRRLPVWDLAMSVPELALLHSLGERDFAVVSFSRAKCMFAGYGAIGLTRDLELIREVRRLETRRSFAPAGRRF